MSQQSRAMTTVAQTCIAARHWWGAIVVLAAYAACPLSWAQDTVYFAHPRTRGETRLMGEVVDYQGKQLEIRVEGRVRTVSAEHVRRIEFQKHAQHLEG